MGKIRFAQVHARVLTKGFVVLIIGNSKSFHLSAQGTFNLYKIFVSIFRDCALVSFINGTIHLYFAPPVFFHTQYRAVYGPPRNPLCMPVTIQYCVWQYSVEAKSTLYMLNRRNQEKKTAAHSYLACFVNTFTPNKYVSMSYIGLDRVDPIPGLWTFVLPA